MLNPTNEDAVSITSPKLKRRLAQASKFGAVGALNTIIDFVIYNVLSSAVGLGLVQANIVSTTIAMAFSFTANRRVVFTDHSGSMRRHAVGFIAVTAFGMYVLQTGTIHLLTDVWLWPMHTLVAVAHTLGITGHDSFLIKNGAKAVATVVSLSWNFVMYKKVVFT